MIVRLLLGVVAAVALLGGVGCAGGQSLGVRGTRTTVLVMTSTEVSGVVSAGPTCPVQRVDQACPPRPVSARIVALTTTGQRVAGTRSDLNGHYALTLSAGSFILSVTTRDLPRCPATSVKVGAAAAITANITCDTGIR